MFSDRNARYSPVNQCPICGVQISLLDSGINSEVAYKCGVHIVKSSVVELHNTCLERARIQGGGQVYRRKCCVNIKGSARCICSFKICRVSRVYSPYIS